MAMNLGGKLIKSRSCMYDVARPNKISRENINFQDRPRLSFWRTWDEVVLNWASWQGNWRLMRRNYRQVILQIDFLCDNLREGGREEEHKLFDGSGIRIPSHVSLALGLKSNLFQATIKFSGRRGLGGRLPECNGRLWKAAVRCIFERTVRRCGAEEDLDFFQFDVLLWDDLHNHRWVMFLLVRFDTFDCKLI